MSNSVLILDLATNLLTCVDLGASGASVASRAGEAVAVSNSSVILLNRTPHCSLVTMAAIKNEFGIVLL